MVETPAAALEAGALAREAEFFSIGTNDLTQYIMAGDRTHPRLAELTDARQPAVLRAIALVTAAARRADRSVAVCGEMAGDPVLAGLLVGLGVGELSMAPASIPAVKRALAGRTLPELRELAERALAAATLAEVAALLAGG
jgi:phosphoenolpyruvate-protein kinase (PTS system EI component)